MKIMDTAFQHLIPNNFSNTSKVWVYQSNRIFGIAEALQIESILQDFVEHWLSHGAEVTGFANLFFGQFIVFMANDNIEVSGCSTSSSIDIVKQIEQLFNVNLFDRQSLAFVIKNKIELLPLPQLDYALSNGFVTGETLYFNNTITNKAGLLNNWIIPVKDSWLASKLQKATMV